MRPRQCPTVIQCVKCYLLVSNAPGVAVGWDSGTNAVDTTMITLPAGKLAYASNYVWKVRYLDSRGAWSSYSAATGFKTVFPGLVGTRRGANLVLQWPT